MANYEENKKILYLELLEFIKMIDAFIDILSIMSGEKSIEENKEENKIDVTIIKKLKILREKQVETVKVFELVMRGQNTTIYAKNELQNYLNWANKLKFFIEALNKINSEMTK